MNVNYFIQKLCFFCLVAGAGAAALGAAVLTGHHPV